MEGWVRNTAAFYAGMLNNLEDDTKVHSLGDNPDIYTFVSGTRLQQGTPEESDVEVLINISVHNSTDESIDSFMNLVILMNGVPIPEGTSHFIEMSFSISPEIKTIFDAFNTKNNPTKYQHFVRESSIGDENIVTVRPGINVFTYVVSLAEDRWASIFNPGEATMSVTAWL